MMSGFFGLLSGFWSRRDSSPGWWFVHKILGMGVSMWLVSIIPWWFYNGTSGVNSLNAVKMVRPQEVLPPHENLTHSPLGGLDVKLPDFCPVPKSPLEMVPMHAMRAGTHVSMSWGFKPGF